MAQGDLTVFEEFSKYLGLKEFQLETDVLKAGIIDNTTPPTAADIDPKWGDYSGNEVGTGGNYTADGEIIANNTYTEADGLSTLDGDNIALAQDPAGFTDGYWIIVYDSSSATNRALAFVEMDGPVSEVAGPVNINWAALGIVTVGVV